MTNFKLLARPGVKIRSIAAFPDAVTVEPPPPGDEEPQWHFREFYYSGAMEEFTVPSGFFGLLNWTLHGSHGQGGALGGVGHKVECSQSAFSGTDIEVRVGGWPFNGGGLHGGGGAYGGGATDLRVGGSTLADRIVAAAGGGGRGGSGAFGGDGGYPTGTAGASPSAYVASTPGTQTAGGIGGQGLFFTNPGTDGSLGQGGNGGGNTFSGIGGGGAGGGFYGGGGGNGNFGGNQSGGGSGGSTLLTGSISSVSYSASERDKSLPGFATVQFYVNRLTDKPADDETYSYRKFFYTGAPELFMVPGGVYWIKFRMVGGNGAAGAHTGGDGSGGAGGWGDRITAWMPVIPGEVLQFRIGENGKGPIWIPTGPPRFEPGGSAYNGGGTGGTTYHTAAMGGGGGGATDIRRGDFDLADRILVAGGGGGGGGGSSQEDGGDAGLPDGEDGQGNSLGGVGGDGGTQTSGYALGNGEGVVGGGGFGSTPAGGGGGYWGGEVGAGGGGGSSYHHPDAEDVVSEPRMETSTNFIEIRW